MSVITLSWNDFAEVARLGMRLRDPVLIQDVNGNMTSIMFHIESATEAAMEALNDKKSKLTLVLESMLDMGRKHPGTAQRRILGSGLGIDLIIGVDGVLRLQLYREHGVMPSITEWNTTMKNFPVHLEERNPERFTTNGRGYMRAAWEMQKP